MSRDIRNLGGLLVAAKESFKSEKDPHQPVVKVLKLHGAIMPPGGGGAMMPKGTLNLEGLKGQIKEAFNTKAGRVDAVALNINCPGGCPTQSNLIGEEIAKWANKTNIPVYTFVEGLAASGGYWLAVGGKEIWAEQSSVTGSIGVISAGWGFDKFISRLGIERRVITSGENKSKLDPFQPEKEADKEIIRGIQREIHDVFIDRVKSCRKDENGNQRLKATDKELFHGDFWAPKEALKRGLIDGIGSMDKVLRDKFGESVNIEYVTPPAPKFFDMLRSMQGMSKASIGKDLATGVAEELRLEGIRAMYTKYGVQAPNF